MPAIAWPVFLISISPSHSAALSRPGPIAGYRKIRAVGATFDRRCRVS
jgi:hypothetical protein